MEKWFVRRYRDGKFLCTDGVWRDEVDEVDQIKFYTTRRRAENYGLAIRTGSTFVVREGDKVDRSGRIEYAVSRLATVCGCLQENVDAMGNSLLLDLMNPLPSPEWFEEIRAAVCGRVLILPDTTLAILDHFNARVNR